MNSRSQLGLINRLAVSRPVLARSTPRDRRKIYEISGGNPLLIEWITGQLGRPESSCRTVEDACNLLERASSGEEALEYVFGDQLATLVDNEISVLATLTHFGSPAQVGWLVQLTGLSRPTIDLTLENLEDRTMLATSSPIQSAAILPLAAKFLRRAKPDAIRKAGLELATFVLKLLEENGYRKYDQFHILDDYWPVIVASFSVLGGGVSSTIQTVCNALFDFPDFYGYWDDYLSLVVLAESAATAEGDLISAGWRVYDQAFIYTQRGQLEALADCVKRAEGYWACAPDSEKSYLIRMSAWLDSAKSDYESAISKHVEFVRIWQAAAPLGQDYIKGLSSLALAERKVGDVVASQQHYEKVLSTAIKTSDYRWFATSKSNLAVIALEQSRWSEAECLAREAIEIFEAHVFKRESIGLAYQRLAKSLLGQDKKREAKVFAEKAVDYMKDLRNESLRSALDTLKQCQDETHEIHSIGSSTSS